MTFVILEYNYSRSSLVSNLSTQAEMMADNCKAAVIFDTAEDALNSLKALSFQPGVVHGYIYTIDGKEFACYNRDGSVHKQLNVPTLTDNNYIFGNDLLSVSANIIANGSTIATVYIQSDLHNLKAMLIRNIIVVSVILAGASLIAFLISSRLQLVISKPILNLSEIAQKVTRDREYSLEAVKQGNDEIGILIDSFNEMLRQINKQRAKMIEMNRKLEDKVKNRTADLAQTIEKLNKSNEHLRSENIERKKAEEELRQTHERLIEVSHQAGMAEVATDVLHNVGNVLNSVNVSATLVNETLSNSEVLNLKKVADMIEENLGSLGSFFSENPKGKYIPSYIIKTSKLLVQEQDDVIKKLESLTKDINHIKDIVKMQQTYAKVSGVDVSVNLDQIIEDAIRINQAGLDRHGIKIVRQYSDLGNIYIDKQKVMQVMVNLIGNAKYALTDNKTDKTITIKYYKSDPDHLRIEVSDNGVGIPEENLLQVFRHGFTTRMHGHGFGLHSGALAAREMKGSLSVHSDGPGHGATFTLELPFNTTGVTV